ncbi:hypothetical protein BSKO_11854 [Bryopsis sp. KO-2023]|nr:hypothetical protein BSKO_11854 [Bryopsis sp. KO-2023]
MASGSMILIDGECVLCDGFTQFVAARDTQGIFFFETQQSNAGQQLLKIYDQPMDLTTVILIEKGAKTERCHVKSTAVLRIMRLLGFPWSLLAMFLILPVFLRDWAYGMVATNRYRLFGKKQSCGLPSEVVRERLMRRLDE